MYRYTQILSWTSHEKSAVRLQPPFLFSSFRRVSSARRHSTRACEAAQRPAPLSSRLHLATGQGPGVPVRGNLPCARLGPDRCSENLIYPVDFGRWGHPGTGARETRHLSSPPRDQQQQQPTLTMGSPDRGDLSLEQVRATPAHARFGERAHEEFWTPARECRTAFIPFPLHSIEEWECCVGDK